VSPLSLYNDGLYAAVRVRSSGSLALALGFATHPRVFGVRSATMQRNDELVNNILLIVTVTVCLKGTRDASNMLPICCALLCLMRQFRPTSGR